MASSGKAIYILIEFRIMCIVLYFKKGCFYLSFYNHPKDQIPYPGDILFFRVSIIINIISIIFFII